MTRTQVLCGTLLAVALKLPANAAPEDYEFQLIEAEVQQADGAVVSVRLIDRRTAEPVQDAVVFATRMDMEPDGMESMTTSVEAIPSDEPGIYQFRIDLLMAGSWRFSVAAKVQGETGTVTSRLVLRAVE